MMSNITIVTICFTILGISAAVMWVIAFIMSFKKPVVIIDGCSYIAENLKVKSIHSKTGEVVIGGFKEV